METIFDVLSGALSDLTTGLAAAGGSILMIGACALTVILGLLFAYLIRIHIAYRMAKNRHRDPLGWTLLSFFVSPLMTWIILLVVGDAKGN